MEKHLGAIVIIVKRRQEAASGVNELLSQFGNIIVSRTGFPYEKRGVSVITLIVDGTTDEIGALTGKLGMSKNVTVKTTLAKV